MTIKDIIKDMLSRSWYNAYYEEVGEKQQKKMDEFLEDNADFISALSKITDTPPIGATIKLQDDLKDILPEIMIASGWHVAIKVIRQKLSKIPKPEGREAQDAYYRGRVDAAKINDDIIEALEKDYATLQAKESEYRVAIEDMRNVANNAIIKSITTDRIIDIASKALKVTKE